MADLEQRLQELEDRLALIELEATYARAFDERDGATWSSLFTPDGIYQSRAYGDAPPVTFVQGSAALEEFCLDAPFVGLHLMHLPQLRIAGDEASARIHLEFHGFYGQEEGTPYRRTLGFYDVRYRRVDGAFKIAHRVTTAFAREQSTVLGYPGPAL